MSSLAQLSAMLDIPALADESALHFANRDATKQLIASRLTEEPSKHWLDLLESAGVWCVEVLDWKSLTDEPAWKAADVVQDVDTEDGITFRTTRCPIRYNGKQLTNNMPAPMLGEYDGGVLSREPELLR